MIIIRILPFWAKNTVVMKFVHKFLERSMLDCSWMCI